MIIYNNRPFLEKFSKELTLVLPAQEVKPVAPLNTIIAQFGLNAAEVCEKFNKTSIIFPSGLLVPVSIFYIPKEKIFDLCFRPIQLKYLLQQFIYYNEEKRRYQIELINLYKILLIKSDIMKLTLLQKQIYFRNIIGTLRSYDRPVEIEFSLDFSYSKNSQFISLININTIPYLINNNEIPNIVKELKKEKKNNNNFNIIDKDNNNMLLLNDIMEDYFDNRFGLRKLRFSKNKRRIKRIIEKKKKDIAYKTWYNIPFSLLLFTPKIKDFHYMKRFLYDLNDCIFIRKQRFFYKMNYDQKIYTNFFCYRIFNFSIYKLYEIMEQIMEYNINILGIEIHNKFYSIEILPLFFETLKNSLEKFFKTFNIINNIFQNIIYNNIDFNREFQYYTNSFLTVCQHIIK